MPNFAVALKEEIRRLARKEIRAQVQVTRRAAAQHRREISRLKQLLLEQDRKIAQLVLRMSHNGINRGADLAQDEFDGVRFSSRWVKAQRARLDFSAEQYGKLVGVSGQTIYHWEQGKARPRKSQLARLVAVRGIGKKEARARIVTGTLD